MCYTRFSQKANVLDVIRVSQSHSLTSAPKTSSQNFLESYTGPLLVPIQEILNHDLMQQKKPHIFAAFF